MANTSHKDGLVEPASQRTECPLSPNTAHRVRAFFTFGLDLVDYVDVSTESIACLQGLRATRSLVAMYEEQLAKVKDFGAQANQITSAAERAQSLGGKAVWSDTFLKSRAAWTTPASDHFDLPGEGVNSLRLNDRLGKNSDDLAAWTFDTVRGHLSPDGVILLTIQFRCEERIAVDQLISDLRALRSLARQAFDVHAVEIIRAGSPLRSALESVDFTPGTIPIAEKVRAHRTVFISSMQCALQTCDAHRLRSSSAVAGVMNLATWFHQYHEAYRLKLSQKEFGYKASELYLTDHDATLAIQSGFWESKDPLRLYMGEVLRAVEYHIGLEALLRGQLQYARSLYSLTTGTSLSKGEAVEGVRQSRAILSGAYESLNYSVLVLHGFTRRLLSLLDQESEIRAILKDVERRVENVSDAVALHASVETSDASHALQVASNKINGKMLIATIIAVVVSVLALVVATMSLASTPANPMPTDPLPSPSASR